MKLMLLYHWKGNTITNTSLEYSIEEELLSGLDFNMSSQLVSRLSILSFSLSAHLHSPLACIGGVANPVLERFTRKNVPHPLVQCKLSMSKYT